MSAEPAPSSPALDPQTWVDLLTVHALKGDMFSVRTLTVIHEGVDKLAKTCAETAGAVAVTSVHAMVFDRLLRAFNNPNLLKEVGILYLEKFRLPAVALNHLELAHQFAPKDRDIEQLQVAAALAVARQVTDQSALSGLDDPVQTTPEVSGLLRQTGKLSHIVDTQQHLDESADELNRKQEFWRKSGALKSDGDSTAPDYSEPLAQAVDLTTQLDFAAAAAALRQAEKAGAPPEELQPYYAQLGLAAYARGRLEEALAAFLHMRRLGPEVIEGWFNCGLVYQKMGQFDDALASYQEAIRIEPENPKPWCNLSAVWFERGDYNEAEKTARRSLGLKADYARAWDNLASALSALDRLAEAAEACRKAIHLQPALHSAWFKYGLVNFQMDNMLLASEAFNAAGDDPDLFGYVLYYSSMIEARRGELEKAVEKFEQASAADPASDLQITALREIAAAFSKAGNHEFAADFLGQITSKHPDDFSAWLALGTARHRSEQHAEARSAYFRAIDLQPDSPVPWHNLGMLASDLSLDAEARDYFQRETELAPDDAKAWYDYGVSLKKLGLEQESDDAFEHAEGLVKSLTRRSSDLSAAMSIVRRLNLGERVLKSE